MGIEDIFNGSLDAEPAAPAAAIEQPPVDPVETPVPVVEEPQPQPEQPQVEPPAPEDQSRHVPLATFLDQRDEAKRWKQEAEQLRQQMQQRQQPQPEAPDPLDDPHGFAAHQNQQVEQRLTQQRFEISDVIARQQHGSEAVEAAGQWAAEKAKADPSFAISYMRQQHPIDWIVQQHKRDTMMTDIGADPDEYVRRRALELGFTMSPAPMAPAPAVAPQQPVAQPATPPRSLVAAPGTGGGVKDVPTGPMASLGSVFTR